MKHFRMKEKNNNNDEISFETSTSKKNDSERKTIQNEKTTEALKIVIKIDLKMMQHGQIMSYQRMSAVWKVKLDQENS